jgi:hypothetical protein
MFQVAAEVEQAKSGHGFLSSWQGNNSSSGKADQM